MADCPLNAALFASLIHGIPGAQGAHTCPVPRTAGSPTPDDHGLERKYFVRELWFPSEVHSSHGESSKARIALMFLHRQAEQDGACSQPEIVQQSLCNHSTIQNDWLQPSHLDDILFALPASTSSLPVLLPPATKNGFAAWVGTRKSVCSSWEKSLCMAFLAKHFPCMNTKLRGLGHSAQAKVCSNVMSMLHQQHGREKAVSLRAASV